MEYLFLLIIGVCFTYLLNKNIITAIVIPIFLVSILIIFKETTIYKNVSEDLHKRLNRKQTPNRIRIKKSILTPSQSSSVSTPESDSTFTPEPSPAYTSTFTPASTLESTSVSTQEPSPVSTSPSTPEPTPASTSPSTPESTLHLLYLLLHLLHQHLHQ